MNKIEKELMKSTPQDVAIEEYNKINGTGNGFQNNVGVYLDLALKKQKEQLRFKIRKELDRMGENNETNYEDIMRILEW